MLSVALMAAAALHAARAPGAALVLAVMRPEASLGDWRGTTGIQNAGATDRRASARRPMACGAWLELDGRAVAVNLLDLSDGGAGVEAPPGIARPDDRGYVVIDTAVLPVRVVAVEDGRVSLTFTGVSPASLATIRSIIAEARHARRA
ncbi:PilZ domain-containing protein [Roseomonas rosulenta]|uniref:PilZ domain-containing protein n=1 Tax=Roseomonas rosulenta TaxID=2748667 RepID=UPI0018DF1831